MADFRYKMPDGTIVEAFQLTPATRYQEDKWPEWMNSKMLLTQDNQEWLKINDDETRIPKFGWIVKAGGQIRAVGYEEMEQADKVVKEIPVAHPAAEVDEDALLELGAKLTGKTVEELREEQLRKGRTPRQPPPVVETEQPDPYEDLQASGGLPEAQALNRLTAVPPDNFIMELCDAYEDLANELPEKARVKFRNILSQRVAWCNCAPGQCAGLDPLICRQESPLAK